MLSLPSVADWRDIDLVYVHPPGATLTTQERMELIMLFCS